RARRPHRAREADRAEEAEQEAARAARRAEEGRGVMRTKASAPWEVRIETHAGAGELADQLEQEGYDVVRRWRYLIVGAASEEEAQQLASRLQGEAEVRGEVVWESMPKSPFAVFFGLIACGWALGVVG